MELSDPAVVILEKLKENWSKTFPEMISWIDDPKQLKLMLTGKTIEWEQKLSHYPKVKDKATLMLMHKSPPKEPPVFSQKKKEPIKEQVDMDVDKPINSSDDKVVPILDRVNENDIDKSALNQLLLLGYDRDLSILALRK